MLLKLLQGSLVAQASCCKPPFRQSAATAIVVTTTDAGSAANAVMGAEHVLLAGAVSVSEKKKEKEKEKTMPFGVNLMRSRVLYVSVSQ